ncbi:MAG: dienelactone hydrolase [Crocinitomicaceae bacterium]|jgi:dienelactone hydrolase
MRITTLCFVLFSALSVFGQPFEVGHTTITFNDPARTGGFGTGGGPGRQIQTEIYYPADIAGDDVNLSSGEFPVIVFAHGFAMGWDAYSNIWEELIPQGFIIAFPRTEGGLFPTPSHDEFGLDLSLIVTKMSNEGTLASSLFFNRISNKSALMGHSMGGGAMVLAAENNTNITTIIGLAPAETNPSAIAAASNVSVPALVFSADQDLVTPAIDHHIPIYNGLASSCKYFINIIGGAHCYYANSNFNCDFGESTSGGNISISRAQQQIIMFRYVLPWLNLYLYDDCDQHFVFETDLALDAEISNQFSCTGFPVPTYDVNVSVNNGTLTSLELGGIYQWVDCDNGNSEIAGASNQSYTVTQNGNYAVVLGTGSCAQMSNCFAVDVVGIDQLELGTSTKELIRIVDLIGRETQLHLNTPLIFIYNDGTRERVMKTEF